MASEPFIRVNEARAIEANRQMWPVGLVACAGIDDSNKVRSHRRSSANDTITHKQISINDVSRGSITDKKKKKKKWRTRRIVTIIKFDYTIVKTITSDNLYVNNNVNKILDKYKNRKRKRKKKKIKKKKRKWRSGRSSLTANQPKPTTNPQ